MGSHRPFALAACLGAALWVLAPGAARAQSSGAAVNPGTTATATGTGTGTGTAGAAPPQAALCSACHGVDGNAGLANTPSLAGQPKVFLENQLVLIREGMRDIAAMKGVLNGLDDEALTRLAAFYAALVPERHRARLPPRRSHGVRSFPGRACAVPAISRTIPAVTRCRGSQDSVRTISFTRCDSSGMVRPLAATPSWRPRCGA